nr:peptidase S8A [uncultured bacterium]
MKQFNTNKPVARLSQTGIAVALAMMATAAHAEQGFAAAAAQQGTHTDQLIVKYRTSGLSLQQLNSPSAHTAAATVRAQRMTQLQTSLQPFGAITAFKRTTGLGAQVIKLDRRRTVEEVAAMAAKIAKDDPNVAYAEPDYIMQPLAAAPNDPRWKDQWDMQNSATGINLTKAWDISTGSGVVVAVIDTGYRPHADLAANVLPGYDMITEATRANDGDGRDNDARDTGSWVASGECQPGSSARDSSWHGTHVAGTIAAVTNNGVGVAGIAPNAKILPVRVLGKCGGATSDIADAIVWASGGEVPDIPTNTTPARVLNLSLGGKRSCTETQTYQEAIDKAIANKAIVVVAAGNSSMDVSGFTPASCRGVVAVAAYGKSGARASYSNYGAKIALAGPGGEWEFENDPEGILSTVDVGTKDPVKDGYTTMAGTSMAAPHVAGVAALMLAAKPSATADEVVSALKSSARPFTASCDQCGSGMLDAYGAVKAIKGEIVQPPSGSSEVEPNDGRLAANAVTAPKTLNATMGTTADLDYYSVQLPAGKTLSVAMAPNSDSDYDVYLYSASGSLLKSSENGPGEVDRVSTTNTSTKAQTYYIAVQHYQGGTGAVNGKYTVKFNW